MVFKHPDFDAHEQVIYCNDPSIGLKAIIALHSTVFGSCRWWLSGCNPYASEEEAVTDVLRLSKGMTLQKLCRGITARGWQMRDHRGP